MIEGRDKLQEAYRDDRVARDYVAERFTSPMGALLHRRQVDVVSALIARESIRRAAEIAPGPARVTIDVAPRLDRVTILDASAQMLGEARRRLAARGLADRVQFVQADAFKLPLAGPFDLVYSFRLIRHFERDDRLKLLRGIAAVLKPGGWLVYDAVNEVVSAPLRANAAPGEYAHYDALLRPDAIEREVAESGLKLESLIGVQHRYGALRKCQIYVAPRSAALARALMQLLDRSGGEPLEWVAVCRRA
jgi:ubiquinone/menaquinone biosynthesis C-methylase UbiE